MSFRGPSPECPHCGTKLGRPLDRSSLIPRVEQHPHYIVRSGDVIQVEAEAYKKDSEERAVHGTGRCRLVLKQKVSTIEADTLEKVVELLDDALEDDRVHCEDASDRKLHAHLAVWIKHLKKRIESRDWKQGKDG